MDHAPPPGSLQQRAGQIEGTIRRIGTQSKELPVVETSILRLVVLLGRELSALLEHSLKPHGLNATDYRTLMTLHSLPGGTAHPSELCASVSRSPANMTRIADSLCERGLITRVPSAEDRRRTVLRITAAGQALMRVLTPEAGRRNAAIFAGIRQPDRQALLELVRTLIAGVDRYERDGATTPPRGG